MDARLTAAFFDRDGTIILDKGYLCDPTQIEWVRGIPELIAEFNRENVPVIVVTNQSGIARGYFDELDLLRFHECLNNKLAASFGAHVDAFYYCPHHPKITGRCECRKPRPGLFLSAIQDFGIDPSRSVCYGDSRRDEEAAIAAGVGRFEYVGKKHRIGGSSLD